MSVLTLCSKLRSSHIMASLLILHEPKSEKTRHTFHWKWDCTSPWKSSESHRLKSSRIWNVLINFSVDSSKFKQILHEKHEFWPKIIEIHIFSQSFCEPSHETSGLKKIPRKTQKPQQFDFIFGQILFEVEVRWAEANNISPRIWFAFAAWTLTLRWSHKDEVR